MYTHKNERASLIVPFLIGLRQAKATYRDPCETDNPFIHKQVNLIGLKELAEHCCFHDEGRRLHELQPNTGVRAVGVSTP